MTDPYPKDLSAQEQASEDLDALITDYERQVGESEISEANWGCAICLAILTFVLAAVAVGALMWVI